VLFPVTFLNDQFHAVGVFEEVSVKVTAKGAVPLVTLGVKLVTGVTVAAETLMKVTWFEISNPALLDAFKTIE
jgi:NhaP-type Na+/H+ and K+/H+ antiporter